MTHGDSDTDDQQFGAALRQMVREAGVGIYQTAISGRIVYANPMLARLLGFDSAESLLASGANAGDFYVDSNDQNAFRKAIAQGEKVEGHLFKARRIDGSSFWVREHSNAVRDESGKIIGYLGTLTDVTDLVETQEKLAEAEASYRRIFERATEGIYRSSLDGKQLRSNPALYRLNGYESEAEHLAAVKDIATEWYVDPNRRDEFKRLLDRDGVVKDFESEVHCHGSRARIWISENAYLVRDEHGNPLYYEGTVRDITQRKRAELATQEALRRAEGANKAKTDFLAHMSHELRTPLNAILGFSDFLRGAAATLSTEKIGEYAEDIHKSGRYLLDLINDVLDLSRVESGAFPLHPRALEVRACVQEAFETVRPMADTRDIGLSCEVEPDVRVTADRRALQQCLLNLLSNAVKFSHCGTRVRVHLSPSPAVGLLCLCVTDNGPGVPQDVLDHIGEPFVSHSNPQRTKQPGSGLGLAITLSLMERMGGMLSMENTDSGAVATLTLPTAGH